MFAVPGWNVSAPIQAQVETAGSNDAAKNKKKKLGKKALKRKEKQEATVSAENLGEIWDKAVEAGHGRLETDKADESRRPAVEKETGVRAEAEAETVGDGAVEKRGKKRKRGKAGGRKNREGGDEMATDNKTETLAAPVESMQQETAVDGQSKRDKKKRKKEQEVDSTTTTTNTTTTTTTPKASDAPLPAAAVDLLPEPKGLTPLQRSMRSKLASARFRHLNESLYTKPSGESLDLFKQDPSMFEDYHRGFQQQVEVWPSNPVDSYVSSILARGKLRTRDPWKDKQRQAKKGKSAAPDQEPPTSAVVRATGDAKPLPRNIKGHCTIADLGCGTASLSYRLQAHLKPLDLSVHSYDLSKPSGPSAPLVTVADISALPLADNSIDIAIFCLALMGTNWLDFIDEAYRVLRWKGELWVSEIKSRFSRINDKKKSVPINSIGSLHKKDHPAKKNKARKPQHDKPEPEGPQDSADEAELAAAVDGNTATAATTIGTHDSTDISAFIQVLRKRGFVLDALPERPHDAIDGSNKMFVKMQFVKAVHPSVGKNAREDQKTGAKPAELRMGIKGKKFGVVVREEEEGGEGDGQVLKPCLYKIR